MIISMLQKTPRDFGFSCNSLSVAYLAVCCVQFVTEEREPKKKTREMHYNTVFILNVQCYYVFKRQFLHFFPVFKFMEDNLSDLKARIYGQKGKHPFLNSYIKCIMGSCIKVTGKYEVTIILFL